MEAMRGMLCQRVRPLAGRDTRPSVCIVDSQSVKATSGDGVRGYDGAKNIRYPTGFRCDCRVSSTSQGQSLKTIKHLFTSGVGARQRVRNEFMKESAPEQRRWSSHLGMAGQV